MTWNAHSYVGLFQTIFYVPALAAATYQLLHKHGRPRMAWMGLTLFSAVRIAGGIVLILFVNNEASVSYIIASLVLQGTGVLPLLLCTIGLLRLIKFFDFRENWHLKRSFIIMRIVFLVSVALVIAGSCLLGEYNDTNDLKSGTSLAKAGYIVIVAVLAFITGFDGFFWSKYNELSPDSKKVLFATSASIPFLAVRIVYSCIAIFEGNLRNPWSPLYGSVATLVVMHSLMEYIVVVMYLVLGFLLPPISKGEPTQRERVVVQDEERAAEDHEVGAWK